MAQHAFVRNPFMLMTHPEVVLAAVEKSERLGQLNRHLCRPLDRQAGAATAQAGDSGRDNGDSASDDEGEIGGILLP